MSLTQHHIPPFQGISNEELERFAAVIAARVMAIVDKGDEVLTSQEAADFLKYRMRAFATMSASGKIPVHRLTENGDPRYLKSQLIEFVKNS